MKQIVLCRLRNDRHLKGVTEKTITVDGSNGTVATLSFDRVFPNGEQDVTFDYVLPFIRDAGNFHRGCTIASYGAPQSGKSYSLTGSWTTNDISQSGLVPRALNYIEEEFHESDVLIELTCVDITDGGLIDLLDKQPQRKSQMKTNAFQKIIVREGVDHVTHFERVNTARYDRREPHRFLELYMNALKRAEKQTKPSTATCCQIMFSRKRANQKLPDKCALRFIEVQPMGKLLLDHCLRMNVRGPTKYRQSPLTHYMKPAIEGTESLALVFCCGNESHKEIIEFSSLAQAVQARIVTPRASEPASHVSGTAQFETNGYHSTIQETLDRKRDFIERIQKDISENEALVEDMSAQVHSRRPSPFSESELKRMISNATKTLASQEDTLMHACQELDCLQEIWRRDTDYSQATDYACDDNNSTSATSHPQAPEQAPEVVGWHHSDPLDKPLSNSSNNSSSRFGHSPVPALPLSSLPKELDANPGRPPYVVGPRMPGRRGDSSDSGTDCSPRSPYGPPESAPSPLIPTLMRPVSLFNNATRVTIPRLISVNRPRQMRLHDPRLNAGTAASGSSQTFLSTSLQGSPMPDKSGMERILRPSDSRIPPRILESRQDNGIYPPRINAAESPMMMDCKRIGISPLRSVPDVQQLQKSLSTTELFRTPQRIEATSSTPERNGVSPITDFRMQTSASQMIQPLQNLKTPAVPGFQRPKSPLPWAFNRTVLRPEDRPTSLIRQAPLIEGRQTPILHTFKPLPRTLMQDTIVHESHGMSRTASVSNFHGSKG